MSLVYTDQWLDIHQGDCRDVLRELPAESVDCVVTSPPYWGLRDYGVDAQIGLESTPEEYVANMVAVFTEVKRVLKPTGTVWLNIGDSYGAGGGAQVAQTKNASHGLEGMRGARTIAPKQLAGIPWRVAFALQADGWYLRSDIIWAKKNGMPESVTDRPTRSHEYVFLLTKSARYFYDIDAVREPPAESTVQRLSQNDGHPKWDGVRDRGFTGSEQTMDINKMLHPAGRNMRDVWWIATVPYPGAHFAVFPPALVEPCIKAGSSEKGVCAACGAPWERVVERESTSLPMDERRGRQSHVGTPPQQSGWFWEPGVSTEKGWRATCACADEGGPLFGTPIEPVQPAVVLDPFAGSGTTGLVANSLSRKAILIDLNPDYVEQIIGRNAQTPLGLTA